MDLTQAELRQAELVVQRLDRYAAITGQACDAEAASKTRQAYESGKVIVENIQRELDAFRAFDLRCRQAHQVHKTLRRFRGKNRGANVDILMSNVVNYALL